MFKIAINAGHGINTPGRRCLKAYDPNEMREWQLNSRICEYLEKTLSNYDGIEILRIDDRSGNADVKLVDRTNKANKAGVDFYLSIHHNAGIEGGSGGGIVAYVYPGVGETTRKWQSDLYAKIIEKTGLRGNRSVPLAEADFHELRETNMPAALLELGFMDSSTDIPIIISDSFAGKCAEAIAEVIIEHAALTKKQPDAPTESVPEAPQPVLPVTANYKIGDNVIFSTCYKSSTDPIQLNIPASKMAKNHGVITKIYYGTANPYLLDGGLCFVNDGDIRGMYSSNTPTTSTVNYTVLQGDNLTVIAARLSKKYGKVISWKTIAEDNKIKTPYVIYTGQTLKIRLGD